MIKILTYGSGNVAAICNIYDRLHIPCQLARNESELEGATKLILPGVGAFDQTMDTLRKSSMLDRVNRMVLEQKVPVLGVCVGMQIMGSDSDEGKSAGLGWIEGNVRRMSIKELQSKPYLPHMGWNSISPGHSHPILDGIDFEKGFYFLHSYCFICSDSENVLTTTRYGADFASSIHRDNIFGFQFHPEKSHHNGVRLFSNFASL